MSRSKFTPRRGHLSATLKPLGRLSGLPDAASVAFFVSETGSLGVRGEPRPAELEELIRVSTCSEPDTGQQRSHPRLPNTGI